MAAVFGAEFPGTWWKLALNRKHKSRFALFKLAFHSSSVTFYNCWNYWIKGNACIVGSV
jgi:hypothetical protein